MATFRITHDPDNPKEATGCIDLIKSEDDGGWYAMEYDFTRSDNATRVSVGLYPTQGAVIRALRSGEHRWEPWS